jgi:DNA-binding MarR family transcriptional regulator
MEQHYDVAKNCLFAKTRTVSRYITNLYTQALKEVNMTPVQYSMLTAIQILEESNINDLSTALKMDRTTINRNLKPLIREGLVFMNESSDKRERLISITDEGRELYQKGYENWKQAQCEFQNILGEEKRDEMSNLLDEIIKTIAKK